MTTPKAVRTFEAPKLATARPGLAVAVPETRVFEKLAAIITDETGAYTPDHQIKAFIVFVSLQADTASDGHASLDELDAVAASSIGVEAKRLQMEAALILADGNTGEAVCAFYNSLSPFQESIVFQTANIKLPEQPPPPVTDDVSSQRTGGPLSQADLFPIYVHTVLTLFAAAPLPGGKSTLTPQRKSAAA
jgi:hypothetical protein